MAMSYHQEARLKQDRIDRWNEQKRNAAAGVGHYNQGLEGHMAVMSAREKTDRVLTTDPGQFNQIRSQSCRPRKAVPFETGVVFDKVVHDPNFNYRLEKAMGGNTLHVNPIYKIMYPASFSYRKV